MPTQPPCVPENSGNSAQRALLSPLRTVVTLRREVLYSLVLWENGAQSGALSPPVNVGEWCAEWCLSSLIFGRNREKEAQSVPCSSC